VLLVDFARDFFFFPFFPAVWTWLHILEAVLSGLGEGGGGMYGVEVKKMLKDWLHGLTIDSVAAAFHNLLKTEFYVNNT
jgi:hypothetical protein